MKTLKFKKDLCDKILDGSKTLTWRLFDDKELKIGDELEFINKDSGETFGTATISSLYSKALGTLEEKDWKGHERFISDEEMYRTYRSYYGDRVDKNSEVKILSFVFRPLLKRFNKESVIFIETSTVKDGVFCDIYRFDNDNSKDLGVVRVKKGHKTPLQKVLTGDKTLEVFLEGQGFLRIVESHGNEITYSFPSETNPVEVNVGDTMQWEATEELVFAEICYPPYEEGRFNNIC